MEKQEVTIAITPAFSHSHAKIKTNLSPVLSRGARSAATDPPLARKSGPVRRQTCPAPGALPPPPPLNSAAWIFSVLLTDTSALDGTSRAAGRSPDLCRTREGSGPGILKVRRHRAGRGCSSNGREMLTNAIRYGVRGRTDEDQVARARIALRTDFTFGGSVARLLRGCGRIGGGCISSVDGQDDRRNETTKYLKFDRKRGIHQSD